MNKQAIEFELEQAKGLYLPRITLEMSAGVRRLENSTRRALGIAGDELYPLEAGIRAEQTLIDFGRRRGEKLREAARVDGAALRVVERPEFIALQSARQYLDVLLQERERTRVVWGKSVYVSVGRGGRRTMNKKKRRDDEYK